MKNDLIERYLYAVTRRMNHKIREDVKNELAALIDDMLMERCGDMTPTEKDIRVVLTELGTPQELYAKYDEDSDKCLIGQPYYSTYKVVLRIVLISVVASLTIANLILQFVEPQPWLDAMEQWISSIWDGLLSIFAVVTLMFAASSRSGVQLGEPYNLDNLPSVPKKKEQISRGECIFSIAFCVVILAVLLAAPQYLIGYWGPDGVIALFDTDVLQNCWYLILIFGLADIVRSTVRLMEGRYNRKVLIATLITNAIGALAVILWLTNPSIINPEFVSHVQVVFSEEDAFIMNIFISFQDFLLVVILLALVLDTVDAAIKTLKK